MTHAVRPTTQRTVVLPKKRIAQRPTVRIFERLKAYQADRRALAELRANEHHGRSRSQPQGFVRSDYFRS